MKIYTDDIEEFNRTKSMIKFFSADRNNIEVEIYLNKEKQESLYMYITNDVYKEIKKLSRCEI